MEPIHHNDSEDKDTNREITMEDHNDSSNASIGEWILYSYKYFKNKNLFFNNNIVCVH